MKTSHQLARELLTGPDLPIWIIDPKAETPEDAGKEPQVTEFSGTESPDGGDFIDALEIHSGTPAMG